MKKIFLSLVLLFSMLIGVNAQTAIETPKLLDNMYGGIFAGAATPLSFNQMFPLNTVAGLRLGKDFTPVFGVNAEGLVSFEDHVSGHHLLINEVNTLRSKTFVKLVNVGLNGTVNLTNLFLGYNGKPRKFEMSTVTGLGWTHIYGVSYKDDDELTAKTALDLSFNFGKSRAHSIVVEPGVYWNLTDNCFDDRVQMSKKHAYLTLSVGYVYHFKTSNGTHAFKLYDVGAMNDMINRLQEENAELKNRPVKVIEKVVEKQVTVNAQGEYVVYFSKGSAKLSQLAKNTLDKVTTNSTVAAYASPEGTEAFNQKLSEKRAQAVADYLTKHGLTVESVKGYGETGSIKNRVAVVTVK